ncbi:MAG: hypothetical protein SOZ40_00175 [Ezakiella sp.]|nr:hypothetical protein [Bacillota bacterium]MDY3946399.1 hypothetical protein [Ezakiella sp.]
MDKFFNKISILFIFVIISFAAFNPIDASGFKDTKDHWAERYPAAPKDYR